MSYARTRIRICEPLGPMSNSTLDDALKGEPPPEWTRRARAKDDLRERARGLRAQGLDLEEIAAALGVAKSSVSLWVRTWPVRPASATRNAGSERLRAPIATGPPSARYARPH